MKIWMNSLLAPSWRLRPAALAALAALSVPLLLSGCGPESSPDAGVDAACSFEILLGQGDRDSFTPLNDGDPLELVLGFQGFRMLMLAAEVRGTDAAAVDLNAFLSINAGAIESSQRDRAMSVQSGISGRIVEDYLIFLNDAPASEIVGQEAVLELIAKSGACTGATSVRVMLRDDVDCVDFGVIVPDAAIPDGGVADGSVACDGGP